MSTDSLPEPDTTRWRDKLDIALDAVRQGRPVGAARESSVDCKAVAEKIFDELDGLHPGWQFEVPMRGRVVGTRDPEVETKRIIATIMHWSGIPISRISRFLGVGTQTIRGYIARGEFLLLRPQRPFAINHPNGIQRTSYERTYPNAAPYTVWELGGTQPNSELPNIEDDFRPADQRRRIRQRDLTRSVYNGDR